MLSRMLTRSQMALLCLGLFLALALCGAWQAFAWGRTQLDTGALVCADTLRLHIRAESDSIASQSAKLHVRDAVLAYLDTACPARKQAGSASPGRRGICLSCSSRPGTRWQG